jgi:hypothetical protein
MRVGKRAITILGFLIALSFVMNHYRSDPRTGPRTWTTNSGRTIEAGFGGVDRVEKQVKLDLGNGNEILYPLHRLSEEDRRWVDESSPLLPGDHSRVLNQLVAKRVVTSAENSTFISRWLELKETLREDSAFVVWIYGQLLGRVPEAEDVAEFMEKTDPAKRMNLIEDLMRSRDFDEHFVEVFLADLLQVNGKLPETPAFADCPEPTAESQKKRRPNSSPEIYEQWVIDQVRMDRPWNEIVKDVLSAKGKYSGNPAGGYLLFDAGLSTVNPARMMTAFAGVETTCAECHDHPYTEVYQMDFFKLAAYFAELKFQPVDEGAGKGEVVLVDNPANQLKLPHDYKYVDGDPGMVVSSGTYFGDRIQPDQDQTLREGFALWMTAESNPRFTLNIANRLWKHVFGTAPIEPVSNLPGILDGPGNEVEILKYVAEIVVEKDYRLKEVLKVLYGTEVYLGTGVN